MARKVAPPKSAFRSPTVEHVDIDATLLVTFDHSDPARWEEGFTDSTLLKVTKGAFVRLRPPPGVSADAVERARKDCVAHGAVAVRVVSPNAPATIPDPTTPEASPHRGIREVVMAMAAEANTSNREALTTALEAHLSEAGL